MVKCYLLALFAFRFISCLLSTSSSSPQLLTNNNMNAKILSIHLLNDIIILQSRRPYMCGLIRKLLVANKWLLVQLSAPGAIYQNSQSIFETPQSPELICSLHVSSLCTDMMMGMIVCCCVFICQTAKYFIGNKYHLAVIQYVSKRIYRSIPILSQWNGIRFDSSS